MSKIKTRENVKGVKVLDKSAVAGQRMKDAFIRSKQSAAALADNRQDTPSEYAGDTVEYAADDLIHDTANVAVSGTKTAARQGRNLFLRQREKKAATQQRENAVPTEQTPSPEIYPDTVPDVQPPQRYSAPSPEGRLPRQYNGTNGHYRIALTQAQRSGLREERRRSGMSELCPIGQSEGYGACGDEERGRALAQNQTAKRVEYERQAKNAAVQSGRPPQIKAQDVSSVPQQTEAVVSRAVQVVEKPADTVTQPVRAVSQSVKPSSRTTDWAAKGTVKSAQRTVKTARRGAKGAAKTAGRASKTAIKTTEQTAKATQKAAQTAAKTAKMTAQAARATAKSAAATAKASAKAVAATVKAIIASVKALVAAIAAGGWVAVLAVVMICLIGLIAGSCFGIFFSGEDSGTGQTMPAVVREINQEYADKLEQIKAANAHDVLEMSGSRAVWPDVLAIYAVKTTTDPDDPQEVATVDDNKKALLKEIFWAMNEISSRTETTTTTQIVETDDGEGNIIEEEVEVTVTTLYITVTHKTADEMADEYGFTAEQRQMLAELLAEENRSMWNAALYGIGEGDGEIVAVALSQIGNVGGEPYWSWYGFSSRVDWCACFVSWCANECGYLDAGAIPKTASCGVGSSWFKDRGLWQDNSYEPRPGDIIYFDWDDPDGFAGAQDGHPDHVGIVEKVENGFVYTVEGNSGDSCREKQYALGYYEIYGYGTPAY